MKRYSHLISYVVLLSGLLIIIRIGVAQIQEEMNIRGRIVFDYPKSPEAKIELNLNGKLIGLVANEATVELLEMLEGVNVRGYHRGNIDLDEVSRYYENKLTKAGWDVVTKVKGADEIVEVHILSEQKIVNGLFIIAAGDDDTILVNIFGRIKPERIGELLNSLEMDGLGDLEIDLGDLDMEFELNLPEFDADYKPKRQKVPSGKREFSEQLDWTLDGAGISVISAETKNGAITLEDSDQDKVIVRAFKRVRARNKVDAEEFAKKVHVHVERRGKEIKIHRKHPKPLRGIGVSVTYEIQCPRAVSVNLHTTNGKIEINGVEGAVDAKTTNGPIELHGGAGRIHAISTNGNIKASVKGLTDEGKFATTNGSIDIELHGGAGRIHTFTTNGPIVLAIRQGVAPVSASTTNGSINLKLPGDFSGHLDAKTSNGQVHSDFPIPFTDKRKKRLSGKIGEGGPVNIKLRTTNGGINLRKW